MKINKLYRATTKTRNQKRVCLGVVAFGIVYVGAHLLLAWSKGMIP